MTDEYEEMKGEFLLGNVNIVSRKNVPLLHYACARGDWGFIVWLVLHGGVDVNALDDEGDTALHYRWDLRTVKFLLWQGCDREKGGSFIGGSLFYPQYNSIMDYLENEYKRSRIVRLLYCDKGPSILHKNLWREVASEGVKNARLPRNQGEIPEKQWGKCE